MEIYDHAAAVAAIGATTRNSTADFTSMTAAQLAELRDQQKQSNIEFMTTVMLLDPWYRRV